MIMNTSKNRKRMHSFASETYDFNILVRYVYVALRAHANNDVVDLFLLKY